jgi:hypothetical protein
VIKMRVLLAGIPSVERVLTRFILAVIREIMS